MSLPARDPFNLRRFTDKQSARHGGMDQALRELRAGRKRGHWIWWNLPQPLRDKVSSRSRKYAIRSDAEAVAYLAYCRGNVSLRNNLLAFYRAVLAQVDAGDGGVGSDSGGGVGRGGDGCVGGKMRAAQTQTSTRANNITLLSLLGATDKLKLLHSLVLWQRIAAMVEDAELGKVVEKLGAAVGYLVGDQEDVGTGLDFRFYNNMLKHPLAEPGRRACAPAALAVQQLMNRRVRLGSRASTIAKLPPRVQSGLRLFDAVLLEATAKQKPQAREQYRKKLNAPPQEIAPDIDDAQSAERNP